MPIIAEVDYSQVATLDIACATFCILIPFLKYLHRFEKSTKSIKKTERTAENARVNRMWQLSNNR